METKIRLAKSEDLASLAEINSFGTAEGLTEATRQLPRFIEAENCILAEADGIVAGLLYWDRHFSLGDSGDWYVQQITVAEYFRRKGIGEALWRHFLNYAKRQGVTDVFADIAEDNEASKRLAEKIGGIKVGAFNLFGEQVKNLYRFKPRLKTILIDAVDCFVSEKGEIFREMYELLESYSNPKIILTNAPREKFPKYSLDKMPYDVFTLEQNPNKRESAYFSKMLEHYKLNNNEVIYFEHNSEAAKSAESVGIATYLYDSEKRDLLALKSFLDAHL